MDKQFTNDMTDFYKQLRNVGEQAREIIAGFVRAHGGSYTIDTENDDLVLVGADLHATAIKEDRNGNILVLNSAQYSEYLHDMDDFNILDLASYLNNL